MPTLEQVQSLQRMLPLFQTLTQFMYRFEIGTMHWKINLVASFLQLHQQLLCLTLIEKLIFQILAFIADYQPTIHI